MKKENNKNFEIFPWNINFETGIIEIDEQHKNMVKLLNKLANCSIENRLYDLEEIFNKLIKYAEYHFKFEENFLEQYIASKDIIEAHIKGHSSFLPKIFEIKERYKDKKLNETVDEILLFLIKWLAFHIIDEDKRLFFFIESKNNNKNTNFIKTNSLKYDKLALDTIHFILKRTVKMNAIKDLKKINSELKELSL